MNYDKAHDLAHAMRESEEYKELMQAQEAVKADAEATALVRNGNMLSCPARLKQMICKRNKRN